MLLKHSSFGDYSVPTFFLICISTVYDYYVTSTTHYFVTFNLKLKKLNHPMPTTWSSAFMWSYWGLLKLSSSGALLTSCIIYSKMLYSTKICCFSFRPSSVLAECVLWQEKGKKKKLGQENIFLLHDWISAVCGKDQMHVSKGERSIGLMRQSDDD